MGARGQRTGRQSAPRPPSGADVLQAVCLARGHRPPAWGRSLGGLGPGAFLQALKELTAPHAVEAGRGARAGLTHSLTPPAL